MDDTKKIIIAALAVVLIAVCIYISQNHTAEEFGGHGGHGGHGGGRGVRGRGGRGWWGYYGWPYGYDYLYVDSSCMAATKDAVCPPDRPFKVGKDVTGAGVQNFWQCCSS
jgi:hypothetical protein